MPGRLKGLKTHVLRFICYSGTAFIILALAGLAYYAYSLPGLQKWHTVMLSSIFETGSQIHTFEQYREQEDALFRKMTEQVVTKQPGDFPLNRYNLQSASFPGGPWGKKTNWNKSFELPHPDPKACVLLLHGMSDSPFSLVEIGQALNRDGAHVLGLRIPGHGTIPSGLLEIRWQDMARAVNLAVDHLTTLQPGTPFYMVGYSFGGALSLNYLLSRGMEHRIKPDGLVLITPAMGISPLARLAAVKQKLSLVPGLEKLAWVDILPEYNPYKYNSFPANAGAQVYSLTQSVAKRIANLGDDQKKALPPMLTFQSLVDATVSTRATVSRLYDRLADPRHELVIFDINRSYDLNPLISHRAANLLDTLFPGMNPPFTLTLLTNSAPDAERIEARRYSRGVTRTTLLDLYWPKDVYSLSHVCLPFSKNNPLYGQLSPQSSPGQPPAFNLGDAVFRGERGLLKIPYADILRLKWNPFYDYLMTRTRSFIFSGEQSDR